MLYLYFLIFIFCLIVIIKSGDILVHSLVKIAHFFNLSEYVVAFILMAFAASVPELFVGITAAFSEIPVISLGNILGSNIINLTLGMGLVILLARGIETSNRIAKRDAWTIFFLTVLPILLIYDGILSRTDGIILLLLFFWYVYRLLGRRNNVNGLAERFTNCHPSSMRSLKKNILYFALGLILILLSAWGIVKTASLIAQGLGISLILIGLTLVSLGTTLPEISFGIRSVLLDHEEMTIGNFIGSVACHSLLILGLVSIIHPITIEFIVILNSSLFLILALLVFNVFIRTKKKLSYKEGITLIFIYILFIAIELLIK